MQKFNTVDEFLESLDTDKRVQVERLREIILGVNSGLTEVIKWNAPSYVLDGEDRVTFNVHNKEDVVKLILHMGATHKEDKGGKPVLDDTTGLIAWNSDIRGMLMFRDLEDIESKRDDVAVLLSQWLAIKP